MTKLGDLQVQRYVVTDENMGDWTRYRVQKWETIPWPLPPFGWYPVCRGYKCKEGMEKKWEECLNCPYRK